MRKHNISRLLGIVCALVAASHGAAAAGGSQGQSHGDGSSRTTLAASDDAKAVTPGARDHKQIEADNVVSYFLANIDRLSANDTSNAESCVQAVGRQGALATVALPKLRAIIADTHYKRYPAYVVADAIRSITEIDPQDKQSLPLCLAFLNDIPDQSEVVDALCGYFSTYGVGAKAAIPGLLVLLKKNSGSMANVWVFNALADLQEKLTALPISALDKRLKSASLLDVASAIDELKRRGPSAASVLDDLVRLFARSPSRPFIRMAVIQTIMEIGVRDNVAAGDCLGTATRDSNASIRSVAEDIIMRLRPDGIGLLGFLDRTLRAYAANGRDRPQFPLRFALAKMRAMGPAAAISLEPIVTLFQRAVHDYRPDPTFDAGFFLSPYAYLLADIGPAAHSATPVILGVLRSPALSVEDHRRLDPSLLVALARIGPPAEAAPDIGKSLTSSAKDPMLFDAASLAAGSFSTPDPRFVPMIAGSLIPCPDWFDDIAYDSFDLERADYPSGSSGGVPSSHTIRMEALGNLGAAARDELPILNTLANDPHPPGIATLRAVAAREAIRKIAGPDAALTPSDLESRHIDATSAHPLGARGASESFHGSDGQTHRWSEWKGRLALFIFAPPYSGGITAYNFRLAALRHNFSPGKVVMAAVFPDWGTTTDIVKTNFPWRDGSWIGIIDKDSAMRKTWGASVVTESFLFDGEGILRYHGRIDDSVFDPFNVHDASLQNAISDLEAGKLPAIPETTAIGEPIPEK